MIGVESLIQLLPVRFELFSNMTRFRMSAFPLHDMLSEQVGSNRMRDYLHGPHVSSVEVLTCDTGFPHEK